MKSGTKFILLIVLLIIGITLMIWGNIIMRNYEGYLEIWKAARHEALPQLISGIVILLIAYFITFSKK